MEANHNRHGGCGHGCFAAGGGNEHLAARMRLDEQSRRPTLSWPRQIPADGKPADVAEAVDAYANWLAQCDIPKLFINAEPGVLLTGVARDFCRTWPNQTEVTVKGLHFIQEDSPIEIGTAIAEFVSRLR